MKNMEGNELNFENELATFKNEIKTDLRKISKSQ